WCLPQGPLATGGGGGGRAWSRCGSPSSRGKGGWKLAWATSRVPQTKCVLMNVLSSHIDTNLCVFFIDLNIFAAASLQNHSVKGKFSLSGSRKLFFDTHALVCLLEENGFTTQQSEIIVSALVKIINTNMDVIYKDMVTKVQQEITLQQVMSHIGGVKKDMIILEKSEFSALRAENEKIKLELQQLKKQVMDEIAKARTDNKLDFNLEKSRVKELYSLNERKLLEIRTGVVEMHAQQDRAITQTDRKIDTEVAGLKTMLESHKLDNIKYLAGSVFTCLTVALGFYRLWM
uniref:Mitochondrial calcium uniporter regulator 1 n=1 Tax=Pelusios castaneus TaxID=367368 RepID=A0A8C8R538_9SAUR